MYPARGVPSTGAHVCALMLTSAHLMQEPHRQPHDGRWTSKLLYCICRRTTAERRQNGKQANIKTYYCVQYIRGEKNRRISGIRPELRIHWELIYNNHRVYTERRCSMKPMKTPCILLFFSILNWRLLVMFTLHTRLWHSARTTHTHTNQFTCAMRGTSYVRWW